jgi:tetratricopeptide (TPR) repeat protein
MTSDSLLSLGLSTNRMKEERKAAPYEAEAETFRSNLGEKEDPCDVLINQGALAMTQGRYSETMLLYRKAQKLDPRRPMAFYQMGLCYLHTQNEADAVHYMEEAVRKYAFAIVTGEVRGHEVGSFRIALDNWTQCGFLAHKRIQMRVHQQAKQSGMVSQ